MRFRHHLRAARLRVISRKPLPFAGYDERLWQAFGTQALYRAKNDRFRQEPALNAGALLRLNPVRHIGEIPTLCLRAESEDG